VDLIVTMILLLASLAIGMIGWKRTGFERERLETAHRRGRSSGRHRQQVNQSQEVGVCVAGRGMCYLVGSA